MVYWTFLIPAIVVVLIIIIVKLDTADNYISRAMASKAMALALTDKEECQASQNENGSRLPAKLKEEWSAKYIDYLFEQGLIEEETVVDEDYASSPLTYGEAAFAAEQVSFLRRLISQKRNIINRCPKKNGGSFTHPF